MCVWSRPAESALWVWETPAVEFGKLCSAHHDSSLWLNGWGGLYKYTISHHTLIYNHCTTCSTCSMCVHPHWSHMYIHTRTLHTQTSADDSSQPRMLLRLSHFSSGLNMTSEPCLCLSLFVSWNVFVCMHIYACVCVSQGVVCTLHEGDDFGKLALVTDSPRAASIVLREDNCHFLRVDKEDFNRILRVGCARLQPLVQTVTNTVIKPCMFTKSMLI